MTTILSAAWAEPVAPSEWDATRQCLRVNLGVGRLTRIVFKLHPRKLTWNLKMMVSNRNLLFQGFIFRFHVKFQGCKPCKKETKTRMAFLQSNTCLFIHVHSMPVSVCVCPFLSLEHPWEPIITCSNKKAQPFLLSIHQLLYPTYAIPATHNDKDPTFILL